jgi:hypothetical protein
VSPRKPIDAVRNEAISLSSSNPNRQVTAYTRRGSVLGNSVSDGRNRDHAVLISFLSTRTRPSDKRELSITGGEDGYTNCRMSSTVGRRLAASAFSTSFEVGDGGGDSERGFEGERCEEFVDLENKMGG